MKLIWPGIFLGTGAVGTVGGLYGNSLYLKSVSRQEANLKFEEIKSDIEKFVQDAANNESFEDNILATLKDSWINLLNLENKNNDLEKLKENLKSYLKKEKEETLKKLYKKIEDFIKFLKDSGIDTNEYQSKIVGISISSEEEILISDN